MTVNEMGPYARMISQVEGILKDITETKAKLQWSYEKIEHLNRVIEEMILKFKQLHVVLQEKHNSSFHEINSLVQDTKRKSGMCHGELEKSAQNCLVLEKEMRSQKKALQQQQRSTKNYIEPSILLKWITFCKQRAPHLR